MKVLVTGANGFVGRALCDKLRSSGLTVLPVVRQTGVPGALYVASIDGNTDWDAALAHGPDVVVHLAARVHAMEDGAAAARLYEAVNVDGTMRLASDCAARGVRRFVYISSAKVMGEGRKTPYALQDDPAPEGAYAESKWRAEQGLNSMAANTGMEVVIIRPPVVYGPGVKGNVAALLHWVRKGWPLPLRGVRYNRRSLVALENLISLIETCLQHPAAANRTFFVTDAEDLSTAGLMECIAKALGKPNRAFGVPEALLHWGCRLLGKQGVYDRLCGSFQLDISCTRSQLGWEPMTTVEQALRQMVVRNSSSEVG